MTTTPDAAPALRRFGRTAQEVPVIGQGTWQMERDARATCIEALRAGLDLGLTHLDTAELYGDGRVETLVGEAIAIGPGDHPACWIDVDRRIVGGEPNKFGGAGFGGRRGPRTLASGGAGGQLLGERGDDAHRRVAIGGLGEIAEGRRRGGEEGDKPGQDGVVELPCGSE